jgi:hypothetical protein
MDLKGSVIRVTRNLGDGAEQEVPLLRGAEVAVSDVHAKYQEAVLRANVFFLNASAAAPTAYVGAAAGTPLIAVHNPVNSGYAIVLIGISIANRVAASAAGTVSFGLWGGPSVIPTGTQTIPTNMASLSTGGGIGRGFVNTVLTGSSALNMILSPATYYWATAAGAFVAPSYFDVAGLVVALPGNQLAIGATSALTSATWDVTLIWEEVPYS